MVGFTHQIIFVNTFYNRCVITPFIYRIEVLNLGLTLCRPSEQYLVDSLARKSYKQENMPVMVVFQIKPFLNYLYYV